MSENRARPKVTNPGKNVVRESLEGLVALNPGLRILENENCIFRHDFRQHVAAGKVSGILSYIYLDLTSFGIYIGVGQERSNAKSQAT